MSRPAADARDAAASVVSRLGSTGRGVRSVTLSDGEAEGLSPVLVPSPGWVGRYRIEGEIARGGIGVVMKGHDVDLGRDIAVKVLRDEHAANADVVARFVEEAQIGGQLQHPGIVPVYEMGLAEDRRPFFTMKWIKGRTLAALLSQRKHAGDDRRRFLALFESVCQTVAYAHARGVIHRDLKPSNVMVGAFGEVLVVDWGLSKVRATGETPRVPPPEAHGDTGVVSTIRSGSTGSHSVVGSVMGTLRYMPPEQARGEVGKLDERSDVFALGAILCEILTGKPPHVGSDEDVHRAAALGRLDDAFARLGSCGGDAEVVSLAKSCLAPDPADRPANAGLVAHEAATYLASLEGKRRAAEVESAKARARAAEEHKRRRLTLSLAGAVVAILSLGAVAWHAVESDRRARADEAHRAVAQALDEATLLRGRAAAGEGLAIWSEALSAARRANALARAPDADPETRERAAAALAGLEAAERDARWAQERSDGDRRLVDRLEEIRQTLESRLDTETRGREVAEVLDVHGFDVGGGTDPRDVGERIKASPVSAEIVAALDAWRATPGAPSDRLSAILDVADSEPWRSRLWRARKAPELRTLAGEARIEEWPVSSLTLLVSRLLRAGESTLAADLALRVQARHSGDLWANWVAAETAAAVDPPRHADAIRFWTVTVALRPRSSVARIGLGDALRSAGEIDRAIAELREAVRVAPPDPGVWLALGGCLEAKGDADGELSALREAVRLNPSDPLAQMLLGATLYESGRLVEAAAVYREALRLDPRGELPVVSRWQRRRTEVKWPGAPPMSIRSQYGHVLLASGDLQGALQTFRESLGIDPNDAEAHAGIGSVLSARGDPAGAVTELREAIRLGCVGAHSMLAFPLLALGDRDGALAESREAVRLLPGDYRTQVNLGQILFDLGRFEEARGVAEEALRLIPAGDSAAPLLLGQVLALSGDLTGARKALLEAIRLEPGLAIAHQRYGLLLVQLGKAAEAVSEFREVVRLDPSNPAEAQNNLGVALENTGDPEGARVAYETAVRLEPAVWLFHTNLGNVLSSLGQVDAALAEHRTALRLAPDEPRVHMGLGNALRTAGRVEEAIREHREAIRLDPGYAQAYTNLGVSLQADGRFAEAAEAIRKGQEIGSRGSRWDWHQPASQVEEADRLAVAETRLADFSKGLFRPQDAQEAADLHRVALAKRWYAACASAAAALFEKDPSAAEDLSAFHRYNAACAAALAAAGKGSDAPADAKTRTMWRRQALAWLRAELRLREARIPTGREGRTQVRSTLAWWREDPDLAAIRDEAAVKELPVEEQALCRALWKDVDGLLERLKPD